MFMKKVRGGSKNKPHDYLQIAESYRDENGKVRHRTICTLGRLDRLINEGTLKKLIKSMARFLDDTVVLDLEEENIKDAKLLGTVLAVEKGFRELGLDKKLERVAKSRKIQFDLAKAVRLMVINRLIAPKSKLSTDRWKERLYNAKEYKDTKLQHLYRSLDILSEESEGIKKELHNRQIELFRHSVKVVFYDLTTIYFESEVADELKAFGYSKDNKPDKVQVVLGVVMSEEGLPVTYEVYPGSTFEGKTVVGMIEKLKDEYEIEKIIFVGDRGLVSDRVLEALKEKGYGYVLAARIKKLPEDVRKRITSPEGWQKLTEDLSVKELHINHKRLIVYKSKALEMEDRARRENALEQIKERILSNPKGLMLGRGISRYIEVKGAEISLKLEQIKKEEELDGIFGFWCEGEEVDKENAYKIYKQLWQVEEAFRSMKSNLKIRSIYHWTPKRIKGHITMCYMAFCVYKWMEKKLKEANLDLSVPCALEELDKVKCVEIETDKGLLRARTEIKGLTNQILRALGVKIPSPVLGIEASQN